MSGSKSNYGNFFEDFASGQILRHATPRTVTPGDQALLTGLYGSRFALQASDEFARSCGFPKSPFDELGAFHIVFGKSVPDISLNAIANLGYADCRMLRPVFVGDTLAAESTVIGLRETSGGKAGVVYIRTEGWNQHQRKVLSFVRWVLVRKRAPSSPPPEATVPDLPPLVPAGDVIVPEGFDPNSYDTGLAGGPHLWGDYEVGERIDHVDGVTVDEAEHAIATRLWHNAARVHFNQILASEGSGKRIVYGGHVISLARSLSFNGLQNAQLVAAINSGTHAAPVFAGDTIFAWSEILDRAETTAASVGALRVRTVALKDAEGATFPLRGEDGRYDHRVALDIDWWLLIPR